MLKIELKNNSRTTRTWHKLFQNEMLLSDRLGLYDDLDVFVVDDYADDIEYKQLSNVLIESFEENLILHLWPFDLKFELFTIGQIDNLNDEIAVDFYTDFYDLEKEEWKVKEFIRIAKIVLSRFDNIKFELNYSSDNFDETYLTIKVLNKTQHKSVDEYIQEAKTTISSALSEMKNELNGWAWKTEYEKNEAIFTVEVIMPLMRKLNFNGVRYFHGINEFGKDVLSYKINDFGIKDFYAVQVKAGNVSGSAIGAVNELIQQIDDAFQMPFELINDGDSNTVSKMIIAISGKFTDNAQKKIKAKVHKSLLGNIIFLDKQDILDLLKR